MSRTKINPENKRQTISIRIPNELLIHLDDIKNKSKFFEWLLNEYFKTIQ
jgi:hypothetical protein